MLNQPVTKKESTMPLAIAVRIIRTMFVTLPSLVMLGVEYPVTFGLGSMFRETTLKELDGFTGTPMDAACLAYAAGEVARGGDLDRVQAEAVAVAEAWCIAQPLTD